MKKITLLLILLFTSWVSNAQVSAYTFSQSVGAYNTISGGTILASQTIPSGTATGALDDVNYTVALPFDFMYAGTMYTTGTNIFVNSNGFVSFGPTAPDMSTYGAIGSTNIYEGAVSAFGIDLNGGYAAVGSNTSGSPDLTITTGIASEFLVGAVVAGTGIPTGTTVVSVSGSTVTLSANCTSTGAGRTFHVATGVISYLTTGVAPNRSLIIEYKRIRPYNVTSRTLDFQIVLNETTNSVSNIYGNAIGSTTTSSPQVGLRGASNSSYNNRTSTTDWAATTAGASNSATITYSNTVLPATGLTFTWTPPACSTPGGFAVSNISATSATISWSAIVPAPSVGYEYYVSTSNVTPTGSGTATTSSTVNLTGLLSNTQYYVWLRSDCGGSQSALSVRYTFNTACDVFAVPFTETFNSDSTTESCWRVLNANADGDAWDLNYTNNTFEGDQVANIYTDFNAGANNDWLISPAITLTGNQRLKYYHRVQSAGEPNDYELLLSTTDNNPSSFTTVLVPNTSYSNTTYEEVKLDLSAYTGNVYIAWHVPNGGLDGWRLYVDNVIVEDIPACVEPEMSVASNITSNSVDVSWNDPSGVQFDYEYVVQAQGTGMPTGSGTAVGDLMVSLNSLTPNTAYEFWVRAYCSVSDQSTWVGPLFFTTECSIYTVPSLENFSTYVPSCWQEADNGDLVAGPATFGSSSWIADGFGNVGSTGAARYNIYTTGANDWLLSPLYDIPTVGYELKFDAAATQFGSTGAPTTPWEADDYVEVLVSTGINNWTVLYTYNNTNVPSNVGSVNVIDLDAYSGQTVRFAFRVVEGAANGSADIDFSIDNFEIRLTPAAAPDCATNVIAIPDASCGNFDNVLSWDAVSGADGYRITLGTTSGGNEVLDNIDLGSVLSYSFAGAINTMYYFTIIPYNGSGNASGCTEVTFTTNSNGCYCVSNPTSVDGNGITNVQILATNFPNGTSTYTDNSNTPVDVYQGISNNVQITFDVNDGFGGAYDYNTVIWIDLNDDFNFDGSEIFYSGLSEDTAPTTLDASFVIPGSATLGNHRMRIVATDFLQTPSNPCYNDTFGVTVDFTINIIAPSCTPPTFGNVTVVENCSTSEYVVNVDVTGLGSGSPSLTDGVTTLPVSATGVVQAGPYAFGSSVTLTLLHGSDNLCDVSVGTYNYTACPPANNDCANAIAITPGSTYASYIMNGNNTAATDSGVSGSIDCGGYSGGDVWYSVDVPASGNVTIETGNSSNGASGVDTVVIVYSGTCGALTEVGCDDDSAATGAYSLLELTGRTPGETLLVRVYEYNNDNSGEFGIAAYDASLKSTAFELTNFMAYPNPVKDVLNLEYTSNMTSVAVYNMIGQQVINQQVNATAAKINMTELNSGTYVVQVVIDGTTQVLKVVKE